MASAKPGMKDSSAAAFRKSAKMTLKVRLRPSLEVAVVDETRIFSRWSGWLSQAVISRGRYPRGAPKDPCSTKGSEKKEDKADRPDGAYQETTIFVPDPYILNAESGTPGEGPLWGQIKTFRQANMNRESRKDFFTGSTYEIIKKMMPNAWSSIPRPRSSPFGMPYCAE